MMSRAASSWLLVVAFAAVAVANEENACDRAQLPWDLDLLKRVEEAREGEELHLAGEYLLAQKGEEQYSEKEEGIVHVMKICDKCTDDFLFRYTISPARVDFAVSIRDASGVEKYAVSSEGGRFVEKSVFHKLQKGSSYYLYVVYEADATYTGCMSVFIELSLTLLKDVVALTQQEGECFERDPKDAWWHGPQFVVASDKTPRPSYTFETRYDQPAGVGAGESFDYKGFAVVLPRLKGHDGQWRLVVQLRSEFIVGGDITAVLLGPGFSKRVPKLEDCRTKSSGGVDECVFGVRGRVRNSYVIDAVIDSDQEWFVGFFRRTGDKGLTAPATTPYCAAYHLLVEAKAESLEETFLSCDAQILPPSFNSPGYYYSPSGEMNVEQYVLLSEQHTTQKSVLQAAYDSVLKVTVDHPHLDVALSLYSFTYDNDGKQKDMTLVVDSDNFGKPETLTATLSNGKYYQLVIDHVYDWAVGNIKWEPHCNKAWMRLQVSKTPLPTLIDQQTPPDLTPPDMEGLKSLSNLPGLPYDFTTPSPFTFQMTGKSTLFAEYEFVQPALEAAFDLHIDHDYLQGEIVAALMHLRGNTRQLTAVTFASAEQQHTQVTVTNPGGNNPWNEGPANLASGDKKKKWLDRTDSPLVFDFGGIVELESIQFTTANDHVERDPVRFVVYTSTTGNTSDLASRTLILSRNDTDWPTPLLREVPAEKVTFTGTSARYAFLYITKVRGYDPSKDVTYSRSRLAGSCLTTTLGEGAYRLALYSDWGKMTKTGAAQEPRFSPYNLRLHVEPQSDCSLMLLPNQVVRVVNAKYFVGDYKAEPHNGVQVIEFVINKPSMLNLDVVHTSANISSVVLSGGKLSDPVAASDYYNKGLHWMMHKLAASERPYKLTFTFGEEHLCDRISLQLTVAALPEGESSSDDYGAIEIADLTINDPATGSVAMPLHKREVVQFSSFQGKKHVHIEMHLTEAAEVRMLLHFAFEFLHIYIDICSCTPSATDPYGACYQCGVARGYSIFNGNHLEAQELPAGYYIVKYYETDDSYKMQNRVVQRNQFAVTIVVESMAKGLPEIVQCGHQELPQHLNGVGSLSFKHALVPGYMHTCTEFLVPETHAGLSHSKSTTFFWVNGGDPHRHTLFRLWLPKKLGMIFKVDLYRLLHSNGDDKMQDPNWPEGSPSGEHGVHKRGEALNLELEGDKQYQLVITFETAMSDVCLTYDAEISFTPVLKDNDETPLTDCSDDTTFPPTMVSRSHEQRHRQLPAKGEFAFYREIPFSITSTEGGRVHVDLRSTFESGGLTAAVHRKGSPAPFLFPVRYLHRDFIQQDLPGPADYVLVVHDMSSHADNVALSKRFACNQYNIHLSVEDYIDKVPAECDLFSSTSIPEAIAEPETKKRVSVYRNIPLPPDNRGGERVFVFDAGARPMLLKTRTRTVSGVKISQSLSQDGSTGLVKAHSIESEDGKASQLTYMLRSGKYRLRLFIGQKPGDDSVEGSKSCNDRVLHNSYDFSFGTLSDFSEFKTCKTWGYPDIPFGIALTADKASVSEYAVEQTRPPTPPTRRRIKLNIDPTLVGGEVYVSLKFDWMLSNVDVVFRQISQSGGGYIETKPLVEVDPSTEDKYTSVLRFSTRIVDSAPVLELTVSSGFEASHVATRTCVPMLLSVVASHPDVGAPEVVDIDPFMGKLIRPSMPYPVLFALSAPAAPSSDKLSLAWMETADGTKVLPTRANFEFSFSTLRLWFPLEYGKAYTLKVDPTKLVSDTGAKFGQNQVSSDNAGFMTYTTVPCSCLDAVTCDYYSPCGLSDACTCDLCPDDSPPMGSDNICKNPSKGSLTPHPTTYVSLDTAAPPTQVPPTRTPRTRAPTAAPTGAPGPRVPSTPFPGQGTLPPPAGAHGGGSKAWVIVLVIIALLAAVAYVAHRTGAVELPCLGLRAQTLHAELGAGDEDLFDSEDDHDDDAVVPAAVGERVRSTPAGGDGGAAAAAPAPAAAAAATTTTTTAAAAGEEGQAMTEMTAQDDELDMFGDPVAAAAPAAAAPAAAAAKPAAAAAAVDPFDPFADLDLSPPGQ